MGKWNKCHLLHILFHNAFHDLVLYEYPLFHFQGVQLSLLTSILTNQFNAL